MTSDLGKTTQALAHLLASLQRPEIDFAGRTALCAHARGFIADCRALLAEDDIEELTLDEFKDAVAEPGCSAGGHPVPHDNFGVSDGDACDLRSARDLVAAGAQGSPPVSHVAIKAHIMIVAQCLIAVGESATPSAVRRHGEPEALATLAERLPRRACERMRAYAATFVPPAHDLGLSGALAALDRLSDDRDVDAWLPSALGSGPDACSELAEDLTGA